MGMMKKCWEGYMEMLRNPKPVYEEINLDDGRGNKEKHVRFLGSEFHWKEEVEHKPERKKIEVLE